MRQDHQRVLLDDETLVGKTSVQFIAVLIDDGAERDRYITEGDNDVAANGGVFGGFQDFEKQAVVLIAELRTDAKELAQGQSCCRVKYSVLKSRMVNVMRKPRKHGRHALPNFPLPAM